MAQKSASNVLEQSPVSTKASADVKGTHGSGYAAMLISFLEAKAEAVVKIQVSLKDKLKGFYDFSDDDFAAYHEETRKYRDTIKAEAEKAKLTVTKFRQSAPGVDYVYVSLSEFDRLARAVKTGWRPDVDRLSWAAIKAEATERLDAQAKAEKREEIAQKISTVKADPKMDPKTKEAHITVLNSELEAIATTTPTRGTGQGSNTGTKSNFQKACEMLDKYPISDLELVAAWLNQKIDAYNKARPGVSKTTNGDPLQKPVGTTQKRGKEAAKTREVKTAQAEHAEAKGSRKQKRK